MTAAERVQTVVDYGFTEREARFLVLVMRHAGLCVKRQYAALAGIANGGERCNALFDKLTRRGFAVGVDCIHNRARLFHVHHKPLYHAIGEADSRYRRAVAARAAAERLMRLDAALISPELDWLATHSEKVAYLARMTASEPSAELPNQDRLDLFPGTFPIGIDATGRAVLVYVATKPWTDDFRSFLVGHLLLLAVTPIRFRMPVNEFAIPRMDPNKQRPIASLEEARDWERVFIGEIKAGRDPRRPRLVQKSSDTAPKDVAGFLDAYVERCVKPAALKSVKSTCSRIDVLKRHLGKLPLDALEEPDVINRFKSGSEYAKRVELATIHRTLETLRAAMNWGMAQTPPLFRKSPFHRFGVRMNKKGETVRDRRLSREEERKLLDAALQKMNTPEHQFVGPLLHDRIIGALELCCRRGEMLLIQNKRVNWETFQIGIPGATAKDKENRRIPFNPEGRLAAILERRAKLGSDAYVFGTATGEYQPELQTAWETLRLLAHGIEPRSTRKGAAWNREQLQRIDLRWHDLRHEGACRLLADGVDIRIIQLMLGHASIQQTQRYLNVTDEELRRGLEVSWNNKRRPLRLASGA